MSDVESISSVSSVASPESSSTTSDSDSSDENERQRQRMPRIFRNRVDQFELYSNEEFKSRFRLSKQSFLYVLHQIEEYLKPHTNRNMSISAKNQLLIALRFYATGSFQNVIGDHCNITKATAGRIVHKVTHEIALLRERYINMPTTEDNINEECQRFFNIRGFPNVCGAIDCTHVRIQSPGGDNGELFRNRKGWFSVNVQVICDARLKIRDVVARHPGSSHDSYIFNNSLVRARFENNEFGNCYLLGDSAYPCRRYLLTPLLHPQTPAQRRYNSAHIQTRNTIERTFGILKRRFACLSNGLRISLDKSMAVIVATCVLHNICIEQGDNFNIENHQLMEQAIVNVDENNQQEFNAVRNAVINNIFT